VRERGVAGAEVVDRDPDAERGEALEHERRARGIGEHGRLRDLDLQQGAVDALSRIS
jgi:hypothetical protein